MILYVSLLLVDKLATTTMDDCGSGITLEYPNVYCYRIVAVLLHIICCRLITERKENVNTNIFGLHKYCASKPNSRETRQK